MQRILFIIGALFSYSLQASHGLVRTHEAATEAEQKVLGNQTIDFASANTYAGQEITADNLIQIAPQVSPALVASGENYLAHNDPLGNIFSGASYSEPILFYDKVPYTLNFSQQTSDQDAKKVYFDALRNTFSKLGLQLKPGQNYITNLNDDWIIKVSGFINRLNNINSQVGNKYGSSVTPEQFEQFMKLTSGKTYQTISRLAYWLRAHEAKDKLGLDRICLPEQYLVHIPGRPYTVEDRNYLIVEKRIHDAKPLLDTPLAGDPEVIQQLTQLIGYTGLWDINSDNLLVHDNKVCIIDTEQPSVHKPLDFFHKDIKVHRDNVGHGWGELERNIIRSYSQKTKTDVSELLELKQAIQTSIQHSWT